ncbi:MBL fold metallo-hydrolase [Streptomyces sp. NBC_00080]|uniref:MBL fold metallo-hydrolase n=1 Tax=Streptomyces sp. NBC_00080 TaxID=2975645 RepID=UPI00325589FB
MDVIELLPRLHLLRFPVGQACLWRDGGELTLVDAGPPGSGGAVAEAVTALGYRPGSVRRIVLTHFHALDRPRALASFRRLASLDTDMACFGHGDPVTTGASAVLRKAAEDHSAPR